MTKTTTTSKVKRIFYPGMYYVVDEDNKVVYKSNNMKLCKEAATEDTDVILVALSNTGSHTTTPAIQAETVVKADKIVLDFDKKLLTITGNSVKLAGAEYEVGEYELDEQELKQEWSKLLTDCALYSQSFEYKGTPPIDGEDITNEMSDLQ